jgi:PBP1b-binding outer membrane lipoprotein LpoB
MKKLIISLIVVAILLSGCVSKTSDTTDNNKTGIGKNDVGGSDTVEKIVTNTHMNIVTTISMVTKADRKFWK